MLDEKQQGYATAAIEMDLHSKCIDYFIRSYPCLRGVIEPEEMQSAAFFACASAARTYQPEKAGISAYFSRAILHELLKSCQRELKHGTRSVYRISMKALEQRQRVKKQHSLADPTLAAFQLLSDVDRSWIERHVFEGVSIRALSRAEQVSSRQARKLLRLRLDRLRKSSYDQPHYHGDREESP